MEEAKLYVEGDCATISKTVSEHDSYSTKGTHELIAHTLKYILEVGMWLSLIGTASVTLNSSARMNVQERIILNKRSMGEGYEKETVQSDTTAISIACVARACPTKELIRRLSYDIVIWTLGGKKRKVGRE